MESSDNGVSIKVIIDALNLLLTPASNRGGKTAEPVKDPFWHHLQQNLEILDTRLSDSHFLSLRAALKEQLVRSDVPSTSGEWQYVNYILQLLHLLCQALLRRDATVSSGEACVEPAAVSNFKPKHPQDAPPLTKDCLSVGHLNTVKNATQFVVCLGVCPNLVPGVGIPLQHRSKLITLAPLDASTLADISQSSESNKARLSVCVSVLVEMFNTTQLQTIIVSSHLNDLLAALLQLLYNHPLSNKTSEQKQVGLEKMKQSASAVDKSKTVMPSLQLQDSGNCQPDAASSDDTVGSSPVGAGKRGCDTEGDTQEEHVAEAVDYRQLHRDTLESVMTSVKPTLLITELLVLQAGIPKQIQSARSPGSRVIVPPGWLKKGCSQLLFRLVKGSQGIQHLYQTVSAGLDPGSPLAWKHCGTVAKIISGHPVQPQFLDQYIANISRQKRENSIIPSDEVVSGSGKVVDMSLSPIVQLTDLLHSDEKEASKLSQLIGAVSAAMMAKYKEAFFRHFHLPLLQPLFHCLESCEEKVDGTVAVSEEDLTCCVQNLHRGLCERAATSVRYFVRSPPVAKVVLALFCVTYSSVYSIKQWIKDLLVSYLKFLGPSEAALCLYHLCIGQGHGDLSLTVRFQSGRQGGMKAVYATVDQQASSLDDNRKVAAIVAILEDLKKDGVAGELLVILLKEMMEIISKESEHWDIVLPSSVLRSDVIEEKKGELMRRVTLLHLLASICETFGSECLSDNTQILLFVKASLERGVVVCHGTSDEEMAIFETESMSMAMGLLTAVMAGAIQMREEDRHLMEEMLPLLEVISQGHTDEFIREMASDIRIAIATRGAVWSSLQESKKGENRSEFRSTENVGIPKLRETAVMNSSKIESSQCMMEALPAENGLHPSQPSPPSRPLIEVLSEHPISDSDTRSEERLSSLHATSPPKPLIEEMPSETRLASKASSLSLKDQKIRSSVATDTLLSTGAESFVVSCSSDVDQISFSEISSASRTAKEDDSDPASLSASSSASWTVREDDSDPSSLSQTSSVSRTFTEDADLPVKRTQQKLVDQTSSSKTEEPSEQSPLQAVFEELCDPLLPVRGHALIALARLVEQKDAETLSKKDVVQKVFEENLQHGDSYLYLAAINGMSALSDCFPESVLHSLANEFAGFCRKESCRTADHRLKVGEALMKATRNLGEMIPKYRELLLGAVLTGARDSDSIVRASSISNLAEVCSLLQFSLGPVLHEVFHCCSSLLETDEAIVRRAVALTLAKLLDGLGNDCFTVLESVLPSLYRLLKKVYTTDQDEAVRLHVHIALEHLDSITRDFAFPRQTLQKNIQVLPDTNTFK